MAKLNCVGAGVLLTALAAAPAASQTSLSIYSDGRTVVRRTLPQALAKGRNTFALELDGVDPAMIFSPDTAVTVASALFRPATERARAIESAAGLTLSFVRGKGDTVRATVVRATPPQYRLPAPDGRFLLVEPGEPLFPSDLVRTAPQVMLVLDAARARPVTELAYITEGARWSAAYQVLLVNAAQAAVSGAATVAVEGFRAESAVVQLVAGTIGRARSVPRPLLAKMAGRAAMAMEAPVTASEEAVGEAHVYTLPGRITLEPSVAVTTALFPRTLAPVTREFIVPGVLPFRGYVENLPNPAEPNRVPVEVWYTLKRPRGTAFGERPLPGGIVQLYEADSAGRVQLLGEASSDHTASGKDLRVQSGEAFDVTVERIQTDYTQEQIPPARRGLAPRQRVIASYRVTISNAKPDPVKVDVRETHAGTWQVVTSSVSPEKLSASEVRFHVSVPAKGETTLTYTVQIES